MLYCVSGRVVGSTDTNSSSPDGVSEFSSVGVGLRESSIKSNGRDETWRPGREEKKRTTSTPLLNSQTDLIGTEKEGTITVTTVNPNFRLTTRLAEDQPLQRAYEVN